MDKASIRPSQSAESEAPGEDEKLDAFRDLIEDLDLDGLGKERILWESKASIQVTDWSPDGLFLACTQRDVRTRIQGDILLFPVEGNQQEPVQFQRTPFREYDAQFCPTGPFLVPADQIPNPQELDIELTVNGQVRQQANTKDMIFPIPDLLAYISRFMTLHPGASWPRERPTK
jgi:dipeptidyl aminopeptidase/acylaminoacyl peptidase